MIDIGFFGGGAKTRYFRTGLAPEAVIADVEKCGWRGLYCWLLEE